MKQPPDYPINETERCIGEILSYGTDLAWCRRWVAELRRLAAVEADRDRLAAEVARLTAAKP